MEENNKSKINLDGCKIILILDHYENTQKIPGKLIKLEQEQRRATIFINRSEARNDMLVRGRLARLNLINEEKGVWRCTGRVGSISDGRVEIEELELLEHVQRRKDVKVNLNYSNMIAAAAKDPQEEEEQIVQIPVTFKDISAGGARLEIKDSNEKLEIGDIVTMDFDLGRFPIKVNLKILRITEETEGIYSYGCQFIDIKGSQESILREFVFRTQLGKKKSRDEDDLYV